MVFDLFFHLAISVAAASPLLKEDCRVLASLGHELC